MKKFLTPQLIVGLALLAAVSIASAMGVTIPGDVLVGLSGMAFMGTVATTITKSDVYTGQYPVRIQPIGSEVSVVPIPFTFPAVAPVANDTHALCKVPEGVQVVDWSIQFEDCDTGGPAADVTLGTLNADLADLATTWKSGITECGTGALLRNATSVAMLETTAAERIVGLKWITAATTYAASKKGLLILHIRS